MAKAAAAKKPTAKNLPAWDLTDLYPAPDSAKFKADIKKAHEDSTAFAKAYEGKLETLSGQQFAQAIAEYERLVDLCGKLGSYAQLVFSTAQTTPAVAQFYQNAQEQLTIVSTRTLFFGLAINKLDDTKMAALLTHPGVEKYESWLRDVRSFRPYQLSDDMEKLLLEKSVTGHAAWNRLFDETLAAMRFPIGKKKLTEAEALDLLSNKDGKVRKEAALVIGEKMKEHSSTFALITNTLAKDKAIEDSWRKFARPISSRNVSNYIEDEVVDALLKAVSDAYPRLAHRYYKIKAKWFGKKALDYWDRNAPLPFDADRSYTWPEAKELVLTSYRNFSKPLAEAGQKFFDNAWIDVPPRPGKASGAFAHPVVPSAHPYLLLNFLGKSRDVMTLAHELGHGVHQVLAGPQGALMADTPLTLAETASVFGEQLTFQEMLRREKNEKRKKALIAGKVEDMLNTVVRQVAFCRFEVMLHDARAKGELTAEQISEIWMQVQSEALGPAIKLHGNYRYFWSYIPHFIHTPFYVYAYAFGDCLVNSLYAVYEKETAKGQGAAFEKKYLNMLAAGGTLRHKELLAPFGLNAAEPKFWNEGLGIIERFIDELE